MTGTDLCVNLATSVPVIFEPTCIYSTNTVTEYFKHDIYILFLSFRRVLNVNYSFLGNSPASEF